jgi:hypothetical protein
LRASSGELLFRRYAPFVPNAVGGDGAAFEGMMARVRSELDRLSAQCR